MALWIVIYIYIGIWHFIGTGFFILIHFSLQYTLLWQWSCFPKEPLVTENRGKFPPVKQKLPSHYPFLHRAPIFPFFCLVSEPGNGSSGFSFTLTFLSLWYICLMAQTHSHHCSLNVWITLFINHHKHTVRSKVFAPYLLKAQAGSPYTKDSLDHRPCLHQRFRNSEA